ncbi:MAG: DUF3309 family protein [Candidatus Binataceae bacterium]|nr:DUF3309 family protein [Candidatus Binataceae bacterium]
MLGLLVLIVLVVAVAGAVPAYPYSANWGYAPTGLLGTILLIWILLLILGRV